MLRRRQEVKSYLLRTIWISLALVLVIGVPSSYANPIVQMRLSTGAASTGILFDVLNGPDLANDGVINFQGPLGGWIVNNTTGQGSVPTALNVPGAMALASFDLSSASNTNPLVIEFTQFNMSSAVRPWRLDFGGTIGGQQGAATYQAFVDNGNGAFVQGTQIGATLGTGLGGFFTGSSTGSVVPVNALYSLTQVITISGSGVNFSGNASLTPVPESNTVVLLGIALLGVAALTRHRVRMQRNN